MGGLGHHLTSGSSKLSVDEGERRTEEDLKRKKVKWGYFEELCRNGSRVCRQKVRFLFFLNIGYSRDQLGKQLHPPLGSVIK